MFCDKFCVVREDIIEMRNMCESKKFGIAIWGAGKRGKETLKRIGKTNVRAFIDRSTDKQGTSLDGIEVLSFPEYQQRFSTESVVVISPMVGVRDIKMQLDQSGYHHYVEYSQLFGGRDFSLKSGERQTGKNLDDIRFDHLCRYQLVDKYLENVDKCLVGGDFFCGTGYGTHLLANHPHVYMMGVDASQEAVSFANRYYGGERIFFSSKVFPFDLPKAYFDFIVSFESIEHVEDSEKFVRIMIDALKPGGILFLSVPNETIRPFYKQDDPFHFRHYTFDEIVALLHPHGTIMSWYGQDTYLLENHREIGLLKEEEMKLNKDEEGQTLVFVFQKK